MEESEERSPSDRLGRNPRERVQSWRTFGQDRWKSKWMSLKLVDLRTQEGQIRVRSPNPTHKFWHVQKAFLQKQERFFFMEKKTLG